MKEPCIVTIELMTDDELTAEAEEFERRAAAHHEHAWELRKYRDERRRQREAPLGQPEAEAP